MSSPTHRRLMREHFTEHGGVEIDTQGDAFFFAFPRARDAVTAAVEAQRAHADHEWPDGVDVRVRMGLHTGEPALGSEGYLGLDVVRAARLCTAGSGGHVLLSETTRALVGASLPEGVSIFPLGERRSEGHRRARAGVRARDRRRRAARSACARPPSLPTPATWEDDIGKRMAARIEASVRRSVEASLERAVSDVDALADRAAKHPDEIAERLEDER